MRFLGFGKAAPETRPRFVFVDQATGVKFIVKGGEVNADPSAAPIEVVVDPGAVGMMGFGIRPGRVSDGQIIDRVPS
jgi:hypothetical protein